MRTLISKGVGLLRAQAHLLPGLGGVLLGLFLFTANGSADTTQFSGDPPAVDPAYAGSYTAVDIGKVPLTGDLGAVCFKDANTLYVATNSVLANGEIDAIAVTRGAGNHITGYSGVATKVFDAPYIDGGLQFGTNGVLFYTAYRYQTQGANSVGQIKPGSTGPDKVTILDSLGVSPSVGSLAFVPAGFGGTGYLKLISWDPKTWYSTYLSPDGAGTFNVSTVESPSVSLGSANFEGIAFINAGQPLFTNNSVLIAADLQQVIWAYEVDTKGNPKTSTVKRFAYVSDPVGMTVDPVTGDILVGTEQGPLGDHIAIIRGFAAPALQPAPAITTSKPLYNAGETIATTFSNALGKAHEWVGIFAAGTSNTSYLQWFYTDGTQNGTAGITNGNINFSGDLSAGNYEARLFYESGFAMAANVAFTVQNGPPAQALNPSPTAGATGVAVNATLSWTPGFAATSHQVYFGTNPNPGAAEYKGSQAGTSYTPGALAAQTAYYWRIDEVNGQGTTTGVVWSFTTGGGPPAVTTTKATYNPGETIVVNFSSASGSRVDWIGLYTAGAANNAYLQWLATDGTQTGTPGIINGSVSFPGGFSTPGNYEARLFFNGNFTLQASVAFTVQSGPQAINPNPSSGATGISLSPTLTWTAGSGATSHQVYFGTNPSPGTNEFKGSQIGTTYAPGTLTAFTTYYWRIDEGNGQGTTIGTVWSFTTGSNPPTITTTKPSYSQGETIVVNFSNASGSRHDWIGLYAAGAANTAYQQWFYTDGTQNGTNGITSGTITFPGGFSTAGNYEARLFFNGTFTVQTNVAFSVQNGPQAINPNPSSGATGISLTPSLTWTAGAGATSHQVYFGTNPNPGTNEFKGTQAGTTYTPSALAANATYYWRIDEINGQGTAIGVVWNFTTGNGPPSVTTTKSTYNPGETIVVNFANASGSRTDWIGLYAAGAGNNAFLQWFCTDGTQNGTPGIINGSVSFPGGFASPGSYEARLFFNGNSTMQASVAFSVQNGPQAIYPNPSSGATGVTLTPGLTWTAGAGATSHQVYFGTNPNPGASEFKGSQAGTSYVPGTLATQTTYYWRIDEINGQGTTTGAVWSFTTAASASTPTIAVTKGAYTTSEPIVVNFKNASGNAADWVGLFAAGAANTAYLKWYYTDGTQTGSSGLINGTVTFPAGSLSSGNYEARLFFNGNFTLRATTSFVVQ